jgi:hypothetical protein
MEHRIRTFFTGRFAMQDTQKVKNVISEVFTHF